MNSKMQKIGEWFILKLFRFLAFFRYKVTVKGLENLNSETLNKPGGILFLPNHCSLFIDPAIVVTAIYKKYSARPVMVEYLYMMPLVKFCMDTLRTLPIPDFDISSNSLKERKSEQVMQTMINDLRQGDNFLMYPAGRTKHTNLEIIGGASATHRILQECPEANIVLVRTKGLFGSIFSRAFPTHQPSLFPTLMEGFKILLKNLIFFAPRRQVIVEFVPAPADFPFKGTRGEVNRWLENWYNLPDGLTKQEGAHPGDSLVLVPYYFWSKKLPDYALHAAAEEEIDLSKIPEDVQQKVLRKLSEIVEMPVEKIKPEMSLAVDLGLDSIDTAEVAAFLQEEFDVSKVPVIKLTTVAKLMAVAAHIIVLEEEAQEEVKISHTWFKPIAHKRVFAEKGDTLIEAYLNIAKKLKNQPAVADERSGVLTYHQFTLRLLLLSEYIHGLSGDYIGIMLPASVAADVCALAIQLAGKVPVMVNWTVGPRHLETVIQLTKLEHVLSSWAFTDRLENVDLTPIEDKILMLEDLRKKFGLSAKLRAFYRSLKSPNGILYSITNKPPRRESFAVILFTSGTESMPKGVPLTHHNIISNIEPYFEGAEIFSTDVLLGFLPPFHSFGFSACSFLGLLSGFRTAFFPNPTEGSRIAQVIEKWKVTILLGAPTFIRGILKVATPEQLKTVRLCYTGAEKAPPELVQLMKQLAPQVVLLEGYGITECSPVLTMHKMGIPPVGVGQPLRNVELLIVHPETHLPLPVGERGLILAHGPNIFSGYLNPGLHSPFLNIEGKMWYNTGDLGFLDEAGNLTISGRMKRFIKVGAEMISLASIEDALMQAAAKKGWPIAPEGPSLAVIAKEQEGGKPKIGIVTRFAVTVDDINKTLRESGFSNLVRVSTVNQVEEIPIMGTGKTNYRILESTYL